MIHRVETARGVAKKKEHVSEGAWPLVAAGVLAASGLGLLAASLIGVGEAAIAGAAGYLAYRRLNGEREESERGVEVANRKRLRAA